MKVLRPHQEKAIAMVRDEHRKGNKWNVIVMPCGAGKTVTAAAIIDAHLRKVPHGRVLVLCHRDSLVEQAYDEMTEHGLECGAIQSKGTRPANPYRSVQIASIQTLTARDLKLEGITLVVFDEAHHSMSTLWSTVPLHYKRQGAAGVALTATPGRGDGVGLEEIWDALVQPVTVKELIALGVLVPFELVAPKRMLRPGQIAKRPVDAYLQFAKGRKTIVFAPNIKSAKEFTQQFQDAGISAGVIHSKMKDGPKRQVMADYKEGKLDVLCSVGVLTEGFDDRPTSCAIVARNVGSLSLYIQIMGRALRASPETGKVNAILIDLFGSSIEHKAPDFPHDWSHALEGESIKKKKETSPEKFCHVCQAYLEDECEVCPDCGTPRPAPESPEVMNQELVKYAAKRREGDQKRSETLARWIVETIDAGQKQGRAWHRYKAVYAEEPSNEIYRAAKEIAELTIRNRPAGASPVEAKNGQLSLEVVRRE